MARPYNYVDAKRSNLLSLGFTEFWESFLLMLITQSSMLTIIRRAFIYLKAPPRDLSHEIGLVNWTAFFHARSGCKHAARNRAFWEYLVCDHVCDQLHGSRRWIWATLGFDSLWWWLLVTLLLCVFTVDVGAFVIGCDCCSRLMAFVCVSVLLYMCIYIDL